MTTQESHQGEPVVQYVHQYDTFLKQEGVPVYYAECGVEDVTAFPRQSWPRLGGSAAFLELIGPHQSERGLFIGEISGRHVTEIQHHLYQQLILILAGRGAIQVWQREGEPRHQFEWGQGSLFAMPKNVYYRLLNAGREPVIFLAITTAPRVMNALGDTDCVFNSAYVFDTAYHGQEDYFVATEDRRVGNRGMIAWYTNFISDVNFAHVDPHGHKVAGGNMTLYRMADGFPSGHISEWPVGRYHKAHFHGPGAILVGLKGKGYVNLWPKEYGIRPWQSGFGDKTIHVEWGPNSIYSPPDGWYHQHMSTGKVPARHVACYGAYLTMGTQPDDVGQDWNRPTSEGGPLINYEDEDPEVRRYFEERLAEEGVECTMPPVNYNADPVVLTPGVGTAVGAR